MEFQWFLQKFEAFVGVNPWTMLFAWLNLLILYLFLKKLAFKPLKNMIDSRQKEVDDMYSNAEKSKSEAEKMKEEYEDKLSRANDESEEILKSAQRRALLKEEEILKEANAEAARTLERAEEQIALENVVDNGKIVKVTYEGGKVFILDYNNFKVSVDGQEIEALSFITLTEGGEG